jgi:hypothetical protein
VAALQEALEISRTWKHQRNSVQYLLFLPSDPSFPTPALVCLGLADLHRRHPQSGHDELGNRTSPDIESNGPLILNFPDSRTVRNESLLFISNPVCDVPLQQPKWAKTRVKSDVDSAQEMSLLCLSVYHRKGLKES